MSEEFVRFGPAHLSVLLATPLLALALAALTKRVPSLRASVRFALSISVLTVEVCWFLALLLHYRVAWKWALPFQLSDMSILLTVFVGFTLHQATFDLVYYSGLTAVPLAMLMPDLLNPFPDPYTIVFFLLHGLVVVILLYLVWSGTLRPGPSSAIRSFLTLNVFMLLVLGVNFALGTNYMYLMHKPEQPSLLDYFGPWPVYILTSEAVATLLFGLLAVPFRRQVD